MEYDMSEDLGRFVRVRKRTDGTDRVHLEVPERLRPAGWPPTIALPEIGHQHGSLADPRFHRRVVADAVRLNARLDQRREREALASMPDRSIPVLAELYFRWDRYQTLGKARKEKNRENVRRIIEWSASRGHPPVDTIRPVDVDDFLSNFDDRPSTKFDMRSTWNMLFATAVEYASWIPKSPLPKGKWIRLEPKPVRLWTMEDVEQYAAMAKQVGQPGLGAMIVTMMHIGQRLGDMRGARWGRNYFGDRFVIRQSKTKAIVNIPVPQDIRDLIESVRVPGSDFVFTDADTGTGFTGPNLMFRFMEIRHALSTDGDQLLYLRALRHSCVVRLFSNGLPVNQIASITGHLLARVHIILERYCPDRWGQAEEGMRRAFMQEHPDREFGDLAPFRARDFVGDADRPTEYRAPEFTERNFERLYAARTGQHRKTPWTGNGADF
jgi:hypothetical protein